MSAGSISCSFQASAALFLVQNLQENLLVRARLEAEDAQRVLLGALNGLAGLMLLDGKRVEAVATFREVLAIGAFTGACKPPNLHRQVWKLALTSSPCADMSRLPDRRCAFAFNTTNCAVHLPHICTCIAAICTRGMWQQS